MPDTIEDMPDEIWCKKFNPGWGGGWWEYTATEGYDRYVKHNEAGEVFAWRIAGVNRKGGPYNLTYFRSERREAINHTIGYRKA